MTKQERENIVGVTAIQTMLRSVEVFIANDGVHEQLAVNGLVTQPMYDMLNTIAFKGYGVASIPKDIRFGQQDSLSGLQTWYRTLREHVNMRDDINLHPLEVTGEADEDTFMCFRSIVEHYRKERSKHYKPGKFSWMYNEYTIMDLNELRLHSQEDVDVFHDLVKKITGAREPVETHLSTMRNMGWKFSVAIDDKNHPVGLVSYMYPNPIFGNVATVLDGIYVDEEHRQRYIGKTLVYSVIAASEKYGYDVCFNNEIKHIPGRDIVAKFLSNYNVKM